MQRSSLRARCSPEIRRKNDDVLPASAARQARLDIAAVAAELDAAETRAPTLPHRERHLRRVHELGRALLQAHEDWLDNVERVLGGGHGP